MCFFLSEKSQIWELLRPERVKLKNAIETGEFYVEWAEALGMFWVEDRR
jgi:hypothetical protein